jgi:benzil reductase ((S)-benzoin forming)
MNYYIITGTSKGLGKSLTDLLLQDERNMVFGLARTNTTKHKNYIHTHIDLSNLEEVLRFQFPTIETADRIVLINNAGIVGDIKHVGALANQKIIDGYTVNLIAPSILVNNFLGIYSHLDCDKSVLNISSGAGKNPVDGWNVYCASKAGINMFSQVVKEESRLNNTKLKVLSLSPGVIDTEMQDEIRAADSTNFSNLDRFTAYKTDGNLVDSDSTAKLVLRFLNEDELAENVICSVKELTE